MSFLNQLKAQARALQSEQQVQQMQDDESTRQTEAAAKTAWLYVAELARQLEVIEPAGPALSLDGKTPWPAMKLVDFRFDARKKTLRDKEVFDYIVIGWRLVPREGDPVGGSVSANFPPELQRIEARLFGGSVKHERIDVRHPEKNTLQAIQFNYFTEARGNVTIVADHAAAQLSFRLVNTRGFEVVTVVYPADKIDSHLLDELAKLIVGQSSCFV